MPYFYSPPQPTQATPHVPIGNQGDAPPRRTWHSLYQVRATWPEPWWPAQSEANNAAFNIAPIAPVDQPPASQLTKIYALRALWPETAWPAQYGARITPLTLVYGDQPPRFNPPRPVWPQPTWNAQSAAPSAGWNVPSVIAQRVPPRPVQWHVWQSWLAPPQPTQRATTLIQPKLGDQPRPRSIYQQMAVRNQWPEVSWSAQFAPPNAGWNFTFIPPLPPPSIASITVRAFKVGQFANIYRNINDTFVITDPYQYSPYWMAFVDTPPSDWVPYLSPFVELYDREMLEFGRPQ